MTKMLVDAGRRSPIGTAWSQEHRPVDTEDHCVNKSCMQMDSQPPESFGRLVRRTSPAAPSQHPCAEEKLDVLLDSVDTPQPPGKRGTTRPHPPSVIENARRLTLNELVPVFVELMEKYSSLRISLHMDASNFLEGGREIILEFGFGECRTKLVGTVTTSAIAFHVRKQNPDVHGELLSSCKINLRTLTADTFREFVCERLVILVRDYKRRR